MTRFEYQPRYDLRRIDGFGDLAPFEKEGSLRFTKDNMRVWGRKFVNKEVRHAGSWVAHRGWVVESWSEGGAPHWQPKMHWVDRRDRELRDLFPTLRCLFPTDAGLQLGDEDKDIEPERAEFIRTAVKEFEEPRFY